VHAAKALRAIGGFAGFVLACGLVTTMAGLHSPIVAQNLSHSPCHWTLEEIPHRL
jgi:hypothetical protein